MAAKGLKLLPLSLWLVLTDKIPSGSVVVLIVDVKVNGSVVFIIVDEKLTGSVEPLVVDDIVELVVAVM